MLLFICLIYIGMEIIYGVKLLNVCRFVYMYIYKYNNNNVYIL